MVNNDRAKLSHTEKAIAEFRNISGRLQEKLKKIADEEDNWVSPKNSQIYRIKVL